MRLFVALMTIGSMMATPMAMADGCKVPPALPAKAPETPDQDKKTYPVSITCDVVAEGVYEKLTFTGKTYKPFVYGTGWQDQFARLSFPKGKPISIDAFSGQWGKIYKDVHITTMRNGSQRVVFDFYESDYYAEKPVMPICIPEHKANQVTFHIYKNAAAMKAHPLSFIPKEKLITPVLAEKTQEITLAFDKKVPAALFAHKDKTYFVVPGAYRLPMAMRIESYFWGAYQMNVESYGDHTCFIFDTKSPIQAIHSLAANGASKWVLRPDNLKPHTDEYEWDTDKDGKEIWKKDGKIIQLPAVIKRAVPAGSPIDFKVIEGSVPAKWQLTSAQDLGADLQGFMTYHWGAGDSIFVMPTFGYTHTPKFKMLGSAQVLPTRLGVVIKSKKPVMLSYKDKAIAWPSYMLHGGSGDHKVISNRCLPKISPIKPEKAIAVMPVSPIKPMAPKPIASAAPAA
jgi:hypothetical protein